MLNIQLIKLMNGEELIAKVKSEDDDTVTVENPAIVMLTPKPDGTGVSVQMGPYCPHTDKDISLNLTHILYRVEPTNELVNGYSKMFGSGLVIPDQTLIG